MAKIFISYPDNLKELATSIENTLKKNSGHRIALYKDQADFILELGQDWGGGDKNPSLFIFDSDKEINDIGKNITESFTSENIYANYPKNKKDVKEHKTILFQAGRVNTPIDNERWGQLVAKGIIKYFNPDYIKNQVVENTVKSSQDKTYYDRSFNSNSTNNSSILFGKKA